MSKEAVVAFVKRLSEDRQLEQQLQEAAKDVPDAFAALVGVAASAGYEFTAEEFQQSQVVPDGELSDAELEGVAGGNESSTIRIIRTAVPDLDNLALVNPTLNRQRQR